MINPGSAMVGFLIVVGLLMQYGWVAAAIIGIPLAIDLVIGWVLVPLLRSSFSVVGRAQKFQHLPGHEQALRRGSQGFALMVLAALAAVAPHVWFYGWRDFAGMLARPDEFWPLIACAALFVIGGARFVAGAPLAARVRWDAMRPFTAVLRLVLGVAALAALMRADLLGSFGTSPAGFYACTAAYAVALWPALVGLVRLVLVWWPGNRAFAIVDDFNRATEFDWEKFK